MLKMKSYLLPVKCDNEFADTPDFVSFGIDDVAARNIIYLAGVAKTNNLFKVVQFDYRAMWLKYSPEQEPEEVAELGDENEIATDLDQLNVSQTEFWFSAYQKHGDWQFSGKRIAITELAEFFGLALPTEEKAAPESNAENHKLFVQQVAGLSLWSYDNDKGEPHHECEEPSEGFLDSHCSLMGLIEQARRLAANV